MFQRTAGSVSKQNLTTEDFINHPEVKLCIGELEAAFSSKEHPFVVSDVLDENGNQYVNLVQKYYSKLHTNILSDSFYSGFGSIIFCYKIFPVTFQIGFISCTLFAYRILCLAY
ncbi:MAG: hypothetical protein ABIR03_09775 [Ginsengibacter sp.]